MHYGRCVSGVFSGIHAVDFGFQVLDTGFFQSVKLRFWILKTRIPHSTSKNLLLFGFPHKSSLDSGIRLSLYGRLNIPPFGIFYKKKLFPFSLPSTLMTNPKPLDTASPVIWFHHSFTAWWFVKKNCWKQHQKQKQIRKIKRRRSLIWHKNPEALHSMLNQRDNKTYNVIFFRSDQPLGTSVNHPQSISATAERNLKWRGGGRGGRGLRSRSGDASLLGRRLGASSPRTLWNLEAGKWYFQHSQWVISLKKRNMDKV